MITELRNAASDCDRRSSIDREDKARVLVEEISSLRIREEDLERAAKEEDTACGGASEETYDAAFAAFLANDLREREACVHERRERLIAEHRGLMAPFSKSSVWEEHGVTMCCECGEIFFVAHLSGRFMERRCPLCGARLCEEAYDSHARKLLRDAASASRGDSGAEGLGKEDLRRLALARYLTSEWYLLSGIPTSARGLSAREEGYSFTPTYGIKGDFLLCARYGKGDVRGIAGEMALFDLLRECIADDESPLHGARLVPSISLPSGDVKCGRFRVRSNQTDCVLLLPTGVIVFEVKHWRKRVRVDARRSEVTVVSRNGRMRRYRPGEGPCAQILANRKALIARVPTLQEDRVGSAVIFVNPIDVFGDIGVLRGGDQVFFGRLKARREGNVRRAVEDCATAWKGCGTGGLATGASALAEKLLSECSCYNLPLDPVGRM